MKQCLLPLFLFLLAVGHTLSAQSDTLPPDYQISVGNTTLPDTFSAEWMTVWLGSAPKEELLRPHDDHFHYRLVWKKLGVSLQVNRPGGHVSGIAVSLGKKHERARGKAGRPVTISVNGTTIDRHTPLAYLRSSIWTQGPVLPVVNGKPTVPWRYRIPYEGRLLNVFLNRRLDAPERVVVTFEGE